MQVDHISSDRTFWAERSDESRKEAALAWYQISAGPLPQSETWILHVRWPAFRFSLIFMTEVKEITAESCK